MTFYRLTIAASLAGIVTLSGCLYRSDIEQGNRIHPETLQQLELGMSRSQVRFLLGQPAIIDLYQPDTWIYIDYLKSGEDSSEQTDLMILRFKNDLLASIKNDRNSK